MSLNLPKPVNTYAGQDELRNTNGNGHSTGNGEEEAEYRAPRMSDRFKATMIYPPKEMRSESISLLSFDHLFASHLWYTT
jgi:splicing factor 3A subunit 1